MAHTNMEEKITVEGGERIKHIIVYHPNKYFPIHTWRVFMKDDMSIGLFLLKPEDFTGKDREAIHTAFRQAAEYSKKNGYKMYNHVDGRAEYLQQVNDNNKCCGCTIM
jgi:hypothetical protein